MAHTGIHIEEVLGSCDRRCWLRSSSAATVHVEQAADGQAPVAFGVLQPDAQGVEAFQ